MMKQASRNSANTNKQAGEVVERLLVASARNRGLRGPAQNLLPLPHIVLNLFQQAKSQMAQALPPFPTPSCFKWHGS